MTLTELLESRTSTRAYMAKEVPSETIREIFTTAQMSASNCNTQPWHVAIVSGDKRERLAKELVALVSSGAQPNPVFQPGDYGLADEYKQRQIDCAMALYDAVGIDRADKVARMQLMLKNFEFFGAPHVAIFSMPQAMKEVNAVDVGIYLQSVMLLMIERGLACCPQGALAFYPDPIVDLVPIPSGNGILFGLSFGYRDEAAEINDTRTQRANFEEFAQMIS